MLSILRSKKGETLVESIASFTLIVLALLGFSLMVAAAMRLNAQANINDTSASAVATSSGTAVVEVAVGSSASSYDVVLLQNEDGSLSGYRASSATEEE